MSETTLDPIEDVIAAIARGEMVVIVDDEDRENEGDLIMAAEFATPRKTRFYCALFNGRGVLPHDRRTLRRPSPATHGRAEH